MRSHTLAEHQPQLERTDRRTVSGRKRVIVTNRRIASK